MTLKNLPIALYLLLVFGSGAVVGALGYRTYNPPSARSGSLNQPPAPGEWRRQYMEESKARLDLTADQVQKLTVILDQTDARFRQARQQDNEAIKQIREEHIGRVTELLTPEQRPKYDQLRMERERRFKQQQESNKSH
jgi:hypothetical protein